jgi:hypothetical protein
LFDCCRKVIWSVGFSELVHERNAAKRAKWDSMLSLRKGKNEKLVLTSSGKKQGYYQPSVAIVSFGLDLVRLGFRRFQLLIELFHPAL